MKIAIIGIGGVGSMAAWRIQQAGHQVVGFEQFSLDHDQGGSYGDSRVVRRVYPDAVYTQLMADAYLLWDELAGNFPDRELFRQIGGIYLGDANHTTVTAAQAALRNFGVPHEVLDARECRRRFPAFTFADNEVAVFEPSMGFARASRCVRAAAQLARQAGAQLHENTTIAQIEPTTSGLRLTTGDSAIHEVDKLLISAGPWTGPRLAALGVQLPLVVSRQTYVHLKPRVHDADFEIGRFPIWIDDTVWVYGFPRLGDHPGVKLADHSEREPATPETVERTVRESDRQRLRDYAARRFPWLGPDVLYEKVCLYTNTPDEDFIVDAIPGLPGAFLIGGLSGHGFKFTPLLGQIGLELLTGTCQRDLSRFSIARLANAAATSRSHPGLHK